MIKDYQTCITVTSPVQSAFEAITQVEAWWSKDYSGNAVDTGDEFTVRFGETWIILRIMEIIPPKRILWVVTNCHKHWLKDKIEWVNTEVAWDLQPLQQGTTITLTHVELQPGMECYGGCEQGWNYYLKESLYSMLTTREGKPSPYVEV